MIKNDPVFGVLEYNYGWTRKTMFQLFGEELEITLMIDGDEDGRFDEKQYTAYQSLIQDWKQVQYNLLQPILDYYRQKRIELGYDVAFNENYPLVETTAQLMKMITLEGIVVPYGDINEERDIGVLFSCTWDSENGLGVRLLNEEIADVGYQDVAI
ncbi:DUF2004 domain-containing protein [Paenibacillus taichungensis]|uniref:DUF6985 domain-containing protein n=1 Tax=Paenibacillus taichungensis TaxID=484184 RepID=UPI002DBE4156|nr:DUF2004 domain-containing protein [Paenibacillus taichungensis]MEC0108477.1 DUF2004 domain-containing protein [Paenibacillus taichungensis]MEC0195975.1 DUF2004 domain-containing protein [Paenibacillus taichungensis]